MFYGRYSKVSILDSLPLNCHRTAIIMRRLFSNPDAQRTYDSLMQARPLPTAASIGGAFFFGYEHPHNEGLPDLCGKPGSVTRAAWAAGVDSRLRDARQGGEGRVLFRGELRSA